MLHFEYEALNEHLMQLNIVTLNAEIVCTNLLFISNYYDVRTY